MGLLTGFSIISGVEILYFATKMCIKVLKKEGNGKLFSHFVLVLLEEFPSNFCGKVKNLHCTDDGEPSEKSHGASNC